MQQPGYSGPMIDGQTLFGAPLDGAQAGLYAPVPVMIGANSADGFPVVTDKAKIFAAYGEQADTARQLYDPQGKLSGFLVGLATGADRMMIEPARAVARALAERQPVWLYRFAYAVPEVQATMGGAPHASEIPYVFNTVDVRHTPKMIDAEASVAALTHRYWINFAKTGQPDGEDVPAWPALAPASDQVQVIDAEGARQTVDPLKQRLDFMEELAAQ